MNLRLDGKRALVCGSTQGIGEASARMLAEMGASVTLFARSEPKLKEIAASLPQSDEQSHDYLVADFNQAAEVKEGLETWAGQGGKAEILINNSGGPPGGLAIDAEPDEFRTAFERHLIVSQIITARLAPEMKQQGFGRIVNIISTSVKAPLPGLGVSNTIRGAVANWAKTLSRELGPFGITVNNILPGATMTGRLQSIIEKKASGSGKSVEEVKKQMMGEIPAGRFAAPEEVATAVAFLCSQESGYINGINLPVDGGRLSNL